MEHKNIRTNQKHDGILPMLPNEVNKHTQPFRTEHFFARHSFNNSGLIEIHQNWITSVLKHFPGNDTNSPIIFRIDSKNSTVYCGIQKWHQEIDPICDDRIVYLPEWMMLKLGLEFNDPINLIPTTLPIGKYIKIRGFMNFNFDPNRDQILEDGLKKHFCLMPDQYLHLSADHSIYICEVKSDTDENTDAICILNIDLEVDFDRPIDYTTPPPTPPPTQLPTQLPPTPQKKEKKFVPFSGTGFNLK
jgi:hypothetical protein